MSEITIYGYPQSTYVRTPRMCCLEKQQPHQVTPIDLTSASYRELHPFAKMPALKHGSVILYETLAIASYIDGLSEQVCLTPRTLVKHSEMLTLIALRTFDERLRAVQQADLDSGQSQLLHDLFFRETAHQEQQGLGDASQVTSCGMD